MLKLGGVHTRTPEIVFGILMCLSCCVLVFTVLTPLKIGLFHPAGEFVPIKFWESIKEVQQIPK